MATKTFNTKQQQRNDTAINWSSVNPTLLAGEIGIETDTGKMKLGNGSTAWNSLGYAVPVTSVNGQTGDVVVSGSGAVTSVNNKTGAVTITKSDVGLASVDNTADANKSVANADTVDNKHASDFLGATATAANSTKLGGSLPSAFAPAPTVLYNNTSGSNSTITLSQSAANFTHMRIYYNRDNSLYQSVDVYNPNGKSASLSTWQGDSSNIYFATAFVSINTTSITWGAGKHIFGYIPNGGTNNIETSATPLKIVRVEAWN